MISPELAAESYLAAAKKHGDATSRGDHVAANCAYDEIIAALVELRKSPDRGAAFLSRHAEDKDSSVACWAATHLLPLDEARAKSALKSLCQNESGIVGFNAEMVLIEWNAGRLSLD